MPNLDHLEVPQYEVEISIRMDKEIKEKVEELERLLRQMKGIDYLGSSDSMIYVSTQV